MEVKHFITPSTVVINMGILLADETQNTTAGWETIASIKFISEFTKLLIHIFELGGAQSIQYRVQGSNDDGYARVVTLEDRYGNVAWTIAALGVDFQTLCDCWGYVRVQVINGTGIGTARCIITGST